MSKPKPAQRKVLTESGASKATCQLPSLLKDGSGSAADAILHEAADAYLTNWIDKTKARLWHDIHEHIVLGHLQDAADIIGRAFDDIRTEHEEWKKAAADSVHYWYTRFQQIADENKLLQEDLRRINKKCGDAVRELPPELVGPMDLPEAVRAMAINNAAYEEGFVGEGQARFDGRMEVIEKCRGFLDKLAEESK